MMKFLKLFTALTALSFLTVACSSTEEKKPAPAPVAAEQPKKEEPTPAVQARSVDSGAQLDSANEKLAKVSVLSLPAYKASPDGEEFKDAAGKALETAKSVEDQIPAGHVLQITGHANKHPDETKRTGISLSVQRAKAVHSFFVKNGFPKEKLAYRGVGSSQYDEKLSRTENRRVTFKIVKAE